MRFDKIPFWLAFWAEGFCVWLLCVNSLELHEVLLGATASALAATACEIVRAKNLAHFRPRLNHLIQFWREPWYILTGCASVFIAFFAHLVRPKKSILRQVMFKGGGSDAVSAARRALAITYTTIPPNFVVIGIDPEKDVMVVHQVTQTATPTMTRVLGAES